ncbi:MAG: FHA domain-containing protein [Myxococcota bacterium]|nr:FHA domain-containing protein [Myxococcota bacterium]
MFQLDIHSPKSPARTLDLKDGSHIVGRSHDVDITIDNNQLSRKHFKITVQSGSAIIEDMGSANGTIIAGQRISTPISIRKETQITVGSTTLTLKPKTNKKPKDYALVGESEEVEGASYVLLPGLLTLGRSEDCNLQLNMESISRVHAELVVQPGGLRVKDLDSRNGTYRNNVRITEAIVSEFDTIAFGTVAFKLTPLTEKVEARPVTKSISSKVLLPLILSITALGGALSFYYSEIVPPKTQTATMTSTGTVFSSWEEYESNLTLKLSHAQQLKSQKKYQSALGVYEEILQLSPINREALRAKETLLMEEQALQLYEKAKKLLLTGHVANAAKSLRNLSQFIKAERYGKLEQLRDNAQAKYHTELSKQLRKLCKIKRWRECQQTAIDILRIRPSDVSAQKYLKQSEKIMSREKMAFIPGQIILP